MKTEIERKFLVKNDSFKEEAIYIHNIKQGYITKENGNTVRVRISDDKCYITIKGPSDNGISRYEWEKEISINEAEELLKLCGKPEQIIEKERYIIATDDELYFEVDVFKGANEGLTIAEIELKQENQKFPQPEWLGKEITGDKSYYNPYLTVNPFKKNS